MLPRLLQKNREWNNFFSKLHSMPKSKPNFFDLVFHQMCFEVEKRHDFHRCEGLFQNSEHWVKLFVYNTLVLSSGIYKPLISFQIEDGNVLNDFVRKCK